MAVVNLPIIKDIQGDIRDIQQIGRYVPGVSGDVRITSSGIIARNSNGINTFVLDGTTGGVTLASNITLGGVSNTSGVLSLRNASNTEIVHMDNTGIQVFNGNIIIQNQSAINILDSKGIISVNNFLTDGASSIITQSTSSTSPVDVSGSTLASFTLSRPTKVITFMGGLGLNDHYYQDGSSSLQLRLVDSVEGVLSELPVFGQWVTFGANVFASSQSIFIMSETTFSAATHTLKLQFYVGGGGLATAFLDSFEITYIVLGS